MREAREEMLAINEAKYDLYHKDFSSAMQHAYKMAKKLHGITVDPKEIDDKVASGPRKPSEGRQTVIVWKVTKVLSKFKYTTRVVQNHLS